jgi:serine/threonine protein kinase
MADQLRMKYIVRNMFLKQNRGARALGNANRQKSVPFFSRLAKRFRQRRIKAVRKCQGKRVGSSPSYVTRFKFPGLEHFVRNVRFDKIAKSVTCGISSSTTVPIDEKNVREVKHLCRPVPSQIKDSITQRQGLAEKNEDPRKMLKLTPFGRVEKFERLDTSCFTKVRNVKPGINGDVYEFLWRRDGVAARVAVKMLRNKEIQVSRRAESDEQKVLLQSPHVSQEDAMTEIRVLSYLSVQPDLSPYLLKMLGAFSQDQHTWLVTEFAEGGELFDVAAAGGLSQSLLQMYIRQILQAINYLHHHFIGHRDVSPENILLKDGALKVMDFGMAASTHTSAGEAIRYFLAAGKDLYRAPECYVPARTRVSVEAPLDATPNSVRLMQVDTVTLCEVKLPVDVLPGNRCWATVSGYTVTPVDVFAIGACMFVLAFQCPPWSSARLSDNCFKFLYSTCNDIESMLKRWSKQALCPEAMCMLKEMLHADPVKRPSAAECIGRPWMTNTAEKGLESPGSVRA